MDPCKRNQWGVPETLHCDSVVSSDRPMPWPQHPKFLIPNKNDTWNDYQKFHRGKIVTTTAWREARDALHRDFREYLMRGGIAQVQASDLEELERSIPARIV